MRVVKHGQPQEWIPEDSKSQVIGDRTAIDLRSRAQQVGSDRGAAGGDKGHQREIFSPTQRE